MTTEVETCGFEELGVWVTVTGGGTEVLTEVDGLGVEELAVLTELDGWGIDEVEGFIEEALEHCAMQSSASSVMGTQASEFLTGAL